MGCERQAGENGVWAYGPQVEAVFLTCLWSERVVLLVVLADAAWAVGAGTGGEEELDCEAGSRGTAVRLWAGPAWRGHPGLPRGRQRGEVGDWKVWARGPPEARRGRRGGTLGEMGMGEGDKGGSGGEVTALGTLIPEPLA